MGAISEVTKPAGPRVELELELELDCVLRASLNHNE